MDNKVFLLVVGTCPWTLHEMGCARAVCKTLRNAFDRSKQLDIVDFCGWPALSKKRKRADPPLCRQQHRSFFANVASRIASVRTRSDFCFQSRDKACSDHELVAAIMQMNNLEQLIVPSLPRCAVDLWMDFSPLVKLRTLEVCAVQERNRWDECETIVVDIPRSTKTLSLGFVRILLETNDCPLETLRLTRVTLCEASVETFRAWLAQFRSLRTVDVDVTFEDERGSSEERSYDLGDFLSSAHRGPAKRIVVRSAAIPEDTQ